MPKQSYETELHNLGTLIKELRELFKLSQTGLAKLLNVSRSVIADIEQEKHLPNILTIFKLSTLFDITPAEFSSEAFANWKVASNKNERFLLHKAMRINMDKIVTGEAINKLRKK
jgi:DNA-binding XRE family transcriptional regulator